MFSEGRRRVKHREQSEKKIASAMEHVHAGHLRSRALLTKRLTFRMHEEEFDEIRQTAESLGMSISEYFCALHHHAAARLSGIQRDAEWVHRTSRRESDQDED